MSNPICWVYPGLCDSQGTVAGKGTWLGDLLDFFSGNSAPDTLNNAINTVRSTPYYDIGLPGFVEIYRETFALVGVLSLIIFAVALVKLAVSNSRGEDTGYGFYGIFKIFLFGSYLPALIGLGIYGSELATKLAELIFNSHDWQKNIHDTFSLTSGFIRLAGMVESGLLRFEMVNLHLALPLLVLLALIVYGFAAFKANYEMGRFTRWMWALVLTSIFMKPVLVFILGAGGTLVLSSNASDGDKGFVIVGMLFLSLFAWIFMFMSINKHIDAAVKNKVRIRGEVLSREDNSVHRHRVDVQQTITTQMKNANDNGKNGMRFARHAAVDAGAAWLGTKLALMPHPAAKAAAVGVKVGHAFLKGRRPSPRP